MLNVDEILAPGNWDAADHVVIDADDRYRRRIAMRSHGGIRFLLNLSHARLLRHGEGLRLSDGRVVKILAAEEDLYRVSGRDGLHLLRLAWHIGNRHLPSEINDDHLLIRRDHVIRDMLTGLGATVMDCRAPFDPEGGAYDRQGSSHGHGHCHDHDHSHSHDHRHSHDHDHANGGSPA